MSDMKCPFCQQELDCMGKYTDGSSKWLCNKCGLFGDKKLFDEIIRTRKALDVAKGFIEKVRNNEDTHMFWIKVANDTINKITALEQKDE